MYLSAGNLQKISITSHLEIPAGTVFSLPEKVLQFGTGVLLRALPDFIIDRANNKALFNGRIVIVKSTTGGDIRAYNKQDGLYTVCIRGVDNGMQIEKNCIISSVSRVLSASDEWNAVLETAASPHMQVIISNTTEVGIALTNESIHAMPPQSYPGKLLSFLYRRYTIFNGDVTMGMVVIPTELIPGNGDKLLAIVKELAHLNNLETSFMNWLEVANYFCNSLVDRIVPGRPSLAEQQILEDTLGYKDELVIMGEAYALWAIESDNERVKEILSFTHGSEEAIVTGDIYKFRELKLRLLNGPHTFSCGLAWLAGFTTVKEAMADEHFSTFIKGLMFDEIIPAITGKTIDEDEARVYAAKVMDRFRNNFINHKWLSICLQYSSKMRLRNMDILVNYSNRFDTIPSHMALGMAAHILFMRVTEQDGKFYGEANGSQYLVEDQHAALYAAYWKNYPVDLLVDKILNDEQLWGNNFFLATGFKIQVAYWLALMLDNGAKYTLQYICKKI
ncbi:MAG: tagaturonate reductase [Ginsengibacter sp.]